MDKAVTDKWVLQKLICFTHSDPSPNLSKMSPNILTRPTKVTILYDLNKDAIKEEIYFTIQEFKRQQIPHDIKVRKGHWRNKQN